VAITSGGSFKGAYTTCLQAFNSAITGFTTDLVKDTADSWQARVIYDVDGEPDDDGRRGLDRWGDSRFEIGANGKLSVYGYNSFGDMTELAYLDQYEDFVEGGYGDYDNTLIVLLGPMRQAYTEVHDGAAPAVPIYLRFNEESGGDYKVGFISLPPGIDVDTGDYLVFRVGASGETFWNGDVPPDDPDFNLADMIEQNLASEWAEMWVHATAFRSVAGIISTDPIYPLGD
jgi:hypothetical protein